MSDKIFYRVLAVLVLFVILSLLLSVFLLVDFFKTEETPDISISYSVDGVESEFEHADVYRGDILMVNFTDVAKMCGYTVSGNSQTQKFHLVTSIANESAEFTSGDSTCKINGASFELSCPCEIENGNVWLPLSFVRDYILGLSIEADEKIGKVVISREKYEPGVSDYEIYPPMLFKIREQTTIDSIGEGFAIALGTLEFKADLSEYEEYMNPADRDAYLLLVNENNTLDESYKPDDLTGLTATRKDGRNTQYMREYAAKALEAMYLEMAEYGITDVSVTSAYRSYAYQNQLFNQYLNENISRYATYEEAYAATRALSALPGTSEHQSGLCCDMHNLSSANVRFAQKEAYAWLKDNCYKFGFIIRYPEDKVDITGYDFEPWHYRYVGRYHATMMHEYNMCLEEYIEFLESNK